MEIHERLLIFFDRLRQAPSCGTAEEALALACRLIEEVEDELCPVPREDPPPMRFTGRMYAPRADRIESRFDGSLVASTRHHDIVCSAKGAIRIKYKPISETILEKPGNT